MEAASLFVIASGMGIVFGWQPMPDQSDRYEYIVQLEPELVATLEAGHAIPITSDIPEDIGPIGRIRIVVGHGDLPREKFVTRRKPLSDGERRKSRDGTVETQHVVPPVEPGDGGRYGKQQILPPAGSDSNNNRAFAQALQQGARQARNQQGGVSQPRTSNILPPQAGQRLASQLEETAESAGNNLRNAGRSVREDVKQLFGDNQSTRENSILRQRQNVTPGGGTAPRYDGPETQTSESILPPDSHGTRQARNDQILPNKQRIDQPVQPGNAGNWHQSGQAGPPALAERNPTQQPSVTSQRGVFDAPWPAVVGNTEQSAPPAQQTPGGRGNNPSDRYTSQQTATGQTHWPSQSEVDPFDVANRDRRNEPPNVNNSPYGNSDSAGPTFPGQNNGPITGPNSQPGGTWPPVTAGAPVIRREMLDQPAGAQLSLAGNAPSSTHSTGYAASTPPAPISPSTMPTQVELGQGVGTKPLFPLLLSWVLLSGSGAGNLYLFWSYLDIRSKYRGMVHNMGPRSGRYS